jgi:hypothetical protein
MTKKCDIILICKGVDNIIYYAFQVIKRNFKITGYSVLEVLLNILSFIISMTNYSICFHNIVKALSCKHIKNLQI